MDNSTLLTIVIPVYNAEMYIDESLDSITNSTYKDFKVIIIENGSSDQSLTLLKKYETKDDRLNVFTLKNKDLIKAMNIGIKKSNTKYIAIMDIDDICPKERFEKQVKFLEENHNIALVGTSIYYFLDENRKWRIHLPRQHNDILLGLMKNMQMIFNPTIMFRADIAKKIGMYNQQDYPVPDLGFFLKISKYGKLANISDISQGFRLSTNSFTAINFNAIVIKQNQLISGFKHNSGIRENYLTYFSRKRELIAKTFYRKAIINYLSYKHILFVIYSLVTFILRPINSCFYLKNKIGLISKCGNK